LFLPESWTSNRARLKRAGVPAEYRTARTKPEIALAEIDRVIAAGVRFGLWLTLANIHNRFCSNPSAWTYKAHATRRK
jgi:SRSO17 transposase